MADENDPKRSARADENDPKRQTRVVAAQEAVASENDARREATRMGEEARREAEDNEGVTVDEAGVMHGAKTPPALTPKNPKGWDEDDDDDPDDGVHYRGVDPEFKRGVPGGTGE